MKQLLFLAAACCIITVSKAQITKGSTMIGGNLGYNYSENTSSDTLYGKGISNAFNFGVTYGKCFKENTFWGVTASFTYSDNKNIYISPNNTYSSQSRNFFIGVFGKKYFPLISNLYLTGLAELGYSFNNSSGDSKGYNIGITANPGISYKASKKIYLEANLSNLVNLGYSHSETLSSNSYIYTQNRFYSNFQLPTQILQNLNVGMTIIMGK